MSGLLYVVATPIGNLEDITYRAVRILKEVDWIACEDTRTTRRLLDHYGISRPTLSYHEHNETGRAAELIARIQQGETGALVSDAGTPLLSDPGYRLVHAAAEAGVRVEALPGPSALRAARVVSGLPTDRFLFAGFLPAKQGQRRHVLESVAEEAATLVFYEAPHRITETLEDITATLGQRPVVVGRELTKLHEETLRGTADEIRESLIARDAVRGEFVVMIGKAEASAGASEVPIGTMIETLIGAGIERMEAIKTVARERGLSKREVYKLISGPRGPKQSR
jgi:16S rRNA (cytidine1402-2'-O)-methyltransferase